MIGRLIISAAGIACTVIAMGFTRPVTLSSDMKGTLTETSPGTYMVNVTTVPHGVTDTGTLAVVDNADIIVDCFGRDSTKAIIKYDGFRTQCKFIKKDDTTLKPDLLTSWLCSRMPCNQDHKPDRPNDTRVVMDGVNFETTITAPRGYVTNYRDKSKIELPDGRVYYTRRITPGHYVDIRIEDNSMVSGTWLFYAR